MNKRKKELIDCGALEIKDGVEYYSWGTIHSDEWLCFRREIEVNGKKINISFDFKGSIHAVQLTTGDLLEPFKHKDSLRDLDGKYKDIKEEDER